MENEYTRKRKEQDKRYYEKNKEKRIAQSQVYYQKNKEKWVGYGAKWRADNSEKIKEFAKKYASSEQGKEIRRKISKRYRKNNPDKCKSRDIAHGAINRGKIKVPKRCDDCGQITKLEMHHEDYSSPLYIDWLCSKCHRLR